MDQFSEELAADDKEEESFSPADRNKFLYTILWAPLEEAYENYIESLKKRPFGCDKCTSRFKRKQDLKQHLNDKHSPPAFKCDFCPRAFTRKDRVRKHCDRIHKKKYVCNIDGCQEAFENKADLSRHLNVPHDCDSCGKTDVRGPWHVCLLPSVSPASRSPSISTGEASNWDSYDLSSTDLFPLSSLTSSINETDDTLSTFEYNNSLDTIISLDSSTSTLRSLESFAAIAVVDQTTPDISDISLGSSTSSSGYSNCQSHAIYGTVSQVDFPDPSPCTAIAATALAFAQAFGPDSIDTSTVIDKIVRVGITLSKCCRFRHSAMNHQNPNLTAQEVSGRLISDDPQMDVNIKLHEAAMTTGIGLQGIFKRSEFSKSLHAFWTLISFQYAIFTLNHESVSFIKSEDYLYIFDSHTRQNGSRPAQVRRFERLEFVSELEFLEECGYVYDYLKNNLLRVELPSNMNSLPLVEAQKYIFSIEVFDIIPLALND